MDTSDNLHFVTRERSAAIQYSSAAATFWIAAVTSLLRNDGEWRHPVSRGNTIAAIITEL